MKIDETSPEHSYRQLAEMLRARISAGEITTQLPSITELTEETGLAVGTVRRAIKVLISDGLVQTVPGRGTYVADPVRGTDPGSPDRAARARPPRPHGHVQH